MGKEDEDKKEGGAARRARPRLTVLRVKRARDETGGAEDAFVVELPKRARTMRFGELSLADDSKDDSDKEEKEDKSKSAEETEPGARDFCETQVFRFVGTVDAGAPVEDAVALCEQHRGAARGRRARGAWRSPLVTQESTRARLDRAAQHAQARRVQARLTATFLARSAATQQAARIVDIAGAAPSTGTPPHEPAAVYDLYVVAPSSSSSSSSSSGDTKEDHSDESDEDSEEEYEEEEEPRLRVRLEAFSETLLRTTGLYQLRRGGAGSDDDDGLEYADDDEDARDAWDDADSNDEDADCNTYPDESNASDGIGSSSSDDDSLGFGFGRGDADDTRYSWYCHDRSDDDSDDDSSSDDDDW